MSKTNKAIALIAALVLLCGIIATVAVVVATHDPNNVKPGLYLDGKKVKDPGVAVTVGSHEVSYDVYRYFYLSTKSQLDSGDATYWEDDADGEKQAYLLEMTLDTLKYVYAYVDFAAEQGIGLSEEEQQTIDTSIKDLKREKGTEFTNYIRGMNFANEEAYREILVLQQVASKAITEYETYVKDNYAGDMEGGVVTAEHILFNFENYGEDAEALALQVEEEIRARVAEGEDVRTVFEEAMAMYDTDPGQQQEGYTGYTFGQGKMVEEFYQGALALQEFEISEPILTSYGYHIILRLPLDEEYVEANYDTLYSGSISALADAKMEERMDTLAVTYGEYYDQFSTETVH